MATHFDSGLSALSSDDLAALRLAAQVMAHRAQLADKPRVAMFFDRIEAEVIAELAARGQRGHRTSSVSNPWRGAGLTEADRAAIAESVEMLAGNGGLSARVRAFARNLLAAERLS
jgi:hypothetical protein